MGSFTNRQKKFKFTRNAFLFLSVALILTSGGCGNASGSLSSQASPPVVQILTAADVTALVQTAAQAADPNTMVIAVVDRSGNILGVYRKPSAPALATGNFSAQVDAN